MSSDALKNFRKWISKNHIHGWNVVFVILAVLAIWFGVYSQRISSDESRRLQLLENAPVVSYGWKSNYLPFMVAHQSPLQDEGRPSSLTGSVQITNNDSQPIHNLQVISAFSFDDSLVRYPYSVNSESISKAEFSKTTLEPGASYSMRAMDQLFKDGFDFQALISGHNERWEQQLEEFKSREFTSETFSLPDHPEFCIPTLDPKKFYVRSLYGRFVVKYEQSGIDYTNVLTLNLGGAQPLGTTPFGLWASHLAKQPYTRFVSFDDTTDYLKLAQAVENNEQEVNELLPDDRRLYPLGFVGQAEGEFRFGYVFESISSNPNPRDFEAQVEQMSVPTC